LLSKQQRKNKTKNKYKWQPSHQEHGWDIWEIQGAGRGQNHRQIHSPEGRGKAIVQNKSRRLKPGEQAETGLSTGTRKIKGKQHD